MEKGKLTIFISYTPGAGKSYLMVSKAMERKNQGENVIIGFLNGSHRALNSLFRDNGIESEPDKKNKRRYSTNEIIKANPRLAVLDEMGMHKMNIDKDSFVYEDIEELLDEGIDVYTTANLKKFSGVNPQFKKISGIGVRRTIPDRFLDMAECIYFVDREPDILIKEYHEGGLFGERYMKTKIMKKNFSRDIMQAYRSLSLEYMKKYIDKTEYILRK